MTKNKLFSKLPNKINLDSKILLLTHTDADGAGATVILKSIFSDVTVKHCTNALMSREIKTAVTDMDIADQYDYIIACDISLNEIDAECVNMTSDKKKLILIDHHQTAEGLNKYPFACVQNEILEDSYRIDRYKSVNATTGLSSGTSLMYDYMDYLGLLSNVKNLPLLQEMVHLIASYDTWDWNTIFGKDPIFNEFQSLCNIYGIDLYEESLLKKLADTDRTDPFDDTDRLLLNIEANKIASHIDSMQKNIVRASLGLPTPNGNTKYYDVVYSYSNKYLQESFECMKELFPDVDLYIINYGTGLSFRATKPEINVADIVKPYRGGGHAGAGGVKIPFDEQRAYIERTLNAILAPI